MPHNNRMHHTHSTDGTSPHDTSHLPLATIFGKSIYDAWPDAETIDAEMHLASVELNRPRTIEELRADLDAGRDIAGSLVALPPHLAARLDAIPPDADREKTILNIAADIATALRLPPTHQIIIHGKNAKTVEIFPA